MRLQLAACAAVIAAGLAMPALAQPDDTTFIQTAIGINLEEIAAGEMAQEKGQSDAVKEYGMMLVEDHTANQERAVAVANTIGAEVPNARSEEAQARAAELEGMSGEAFDMAFIDMMIAGHTTAIEVFTAASASATPEVAAYATETLPALQHHLEESQAIKSQLPAGGASPAATNQAPTDGSTMDTQMPADSGSSSSSDNGSSGSDVQPPADQQPPANQ